MPDAPSPTTPSAPSAPAAVSTAFTPAPVAAAPLPEVTDDSFPAEVLESPTPVLVDFTATWCPPCRVLRPTLERIASERDDLRVVTLDTDLHPVTAARHQILSAPTLILFRDGAPVMRVVGNRPYGRLSGELDQALQGLVP